MQNINDYDQRMRGSISRVLHTQDGTAAPIHGEWESGVNRGRAELDHRKVLDIKWAMKKGSESFMYFKKKSMHMH